jgi:hypothetical protein
MPEFPVSSKLKLLVLSPIQSINKMGTFTVKLFTVVINSET